jgi:hypothetical protein
MASLFNLEASASNQIPASQTFDHSRSLWGHSRAGGLGPPAGRKNGRSHGIRGMLRHLSHPSHSSMATQHSSAASASAVGEIVPQGVHDPAANWRQPALLTREPHSNRVMLAGATELKAGPL